MKYDLGIIGGLGPLASAYMYKLITEKTKAKNDQDHLNIIILSHPEIPDRTKYILNNNEKNPYPYLLNDCKTLEKLGVKMISIPCNTSCYFHEKLQKEINIPINNLIKNTIKYLKEKNIEEVAILATEGTINSKLYQNELKKENIKYVLPDQEQITNIIYNYIKAGKQLDKDIFNNAIKNLKTNYYILGCTELSILKQKLNLPDNYIDPLEIEVENILKYFNKSKGE